MLTTKPMDFFRSLPAKQCAECGELIEEQAESYLTECDRCLSKSEEYLMMIWRN
jgi:hypothetical protein